MFEPMKSKAQVLNEKKQIIFRHFRRLLRELDETIHFIELDQANFNTFSINNSNFIKETCGYIDSIYGLLDISEIKKINNESNVSHLYRYFKEHRNEDFSLIKIRTTAGDRFPWKGEQIQDKYKFLWWDANNSLKHAYYDERNSATFCNLIDSLGAFLILILFLFKDDDYPNIFSQNDLIHALGPNEATVGAYFHGPKGSIDEKIWSIVRETTRAQASKVQKPKQTPRA